MPDIYDRIKQDHDAARALMARIEETSNGDKAARRELFDEFKIDMWAHHKIEEAVFYDALRTDPDMKGEAFEALNEHHTTNGLMEELDTMPVDSEEWTQKFHALKEMVEHHMEEEEEDTFPKAREVIPAERADALGEQFDARKTVVIPALTAV